MYHKSRAAWNVALYLFNDYGLYTMMREEVAMTARRRVFKGLRGKGLDVAAENLLARLPERTPDGDRYTKTSVRLALQHWED